MIDVLRRVPRPLLLGTGLSFGFGVYMLAQVVIGFGLDERARHDVISLTNGISFAALGLAFAGALELARARTGAAHLGALLAAIGLAIQAAAFVLQYAANAYLLVHELHMEYLSIFRSISIIATCGMLLATTGLGLASGRWYVAVIGAVAVAVVVLPGLFGADWFVYIRRSDGEGWSRSQQFMPYGLTVIIPAVKFGLAIAAGEGLERTAEPARAPIGLRQVAFALRLRVYACLLFVASAMFFVRVSISDRHLVSSIAVISVIAVAANAAIVIAFARGALAAARAELADLPRWPLVVAAGSMLWIVGAMLRGLLALVEVVWGRGSGFYALAEPGPGLFNRFDLEIALGSGVAIACVLGSITALAHRRGLTALAATATSRTVLFVSVMLGGALARYFLLGDTPLVAMLNLGVVIAEVVATLLAAGAIDQTVSALGGAPGLPAAKLVNG